MAKLDYAHEQYLADCFNKNYPLGSIMEMGGMLLKTRAKAMVIKDAGACVWFHGVGPGFPIDRVFPVLTVEGLIKV